MVNRLRRWTAVQAPIAAGVPKMADVRAIRLALPCRQNVVTQAEFARRFGFSLGAVQDWEQGRKKPEGAARLLLFLIAHDAAGVEAMIRAAMVASSVAAA